MRRLTIPISLLCATLALLLTGSELRASEGGHHHHKRGNYAITIAGNFTGSGSATLTNTLSMSVPVTLKDGTSGTLEVDALAIDADGYFVGAGTVLGVTMRISGRVDIPAGDDSETTPKQANTGRISAVFRTTDGRAGRIVGIQTSKSHP